MLWLCPVRTLGSLGQVEGRGREGLAAGTASLSLPLALASLPTQTGQDRRRPRVQGPLAMGVGGGTAPNKHPASPVQGAPSAAPGRQNSLQAGVQETPLRPPPLLPAWGLGAQGAYLPALPWVLCRAVPRSSVGAAYCSGCLPSCPLLPSHLAWHRAPPSLSTARPTGLLWAKPLVAEGQPPCPHNLIGPAAPWACLVAWYLEVATHHLHGLCLGVA